MGQLSPVAIVVSSLALILSVVSLVITNRQTRKTRTLSILSGLLDELRSTEYRRNLDFVLRELHLERGTEAPPLSALPREVRERIRPVAAFYNAVGAIYARGLSDLTLLSALMGGSVTSAWIKLQPYILADRATRRDGAGDPMYYRFFEHLAAAFDTEATPEVLEGSVRLKRWRAS